MRGPITFVAGLAAATALGAAAMAGAGAAAAAFLGVWAAWAVAIVALRRRDEPAPAAARRAAVPVLALAVLPLAAPDFVLRALAPRRALLVLAAAVLLFALYVALARGAGAGAADWTRRHAFALVAGGAAVYAGLGVAFVALKYGRSLDHFTGHDAAYHLQLLWNTLEGRPLQATVLQQLNFTPAVSSNFAFHVELFHLGLLPVYALLPGPVTVHAVRTAALALAAIPLYRLLARETDPLFGLLAAVVYLAYPTTVFQSVGGFYPIQLAAPLLVVTFLLYRTRRFAPFVALLLLTMSTREDVALTVAMLGPVAWLEGRSARWVVTPPALAIPWWAVAYFVVMPAYGAGGGNGYRAVAELAGAAASAGTALQVAVQALTPATANYLYQLLKPAAFTPLTDPGCLLLLPMAAINALLAIPYHGAQVKIHLYASALAPVVVAVSLPGAARLAKRLAWTGVAPHALRLAVLGVALPLALMAGKDALSAPMATLRADLADAPPAALLGLIPPAASVAAPIHLLPALADRKQLYWVQKIADYSVPVDPEFVIVATDRRDFDRLDVLRRPGAWERYARYLRVLETDGHRRLWADGRYAVYARR